MTDQPLLDIRGVSFSYGATQVLFDISLTVHAGEAVALLGTNGAGKSTLLRVASGLERPSEGEVWFAGERIDGLAAERVVRHGLVLVPGGRSVFPDMTVAENLEMQAVLLRGRRSIVRERVDIVFDSFPRLRERLNTAAGALSGGEQQQLAMAKALILDPTLLCIDELSLGLAPVVVQELLEIVRRIRATGIAVLLVEQSLNIAAALTDRALFLEKGEVRFEGPTSELLERDDIARAVFLGS